MRPLTLSHRELPPAAPGQPAVQPVLPGVCPRVRTERVVVPAGATWAPELYAPHTYIQILLVQSGSGYIATPSQAYNLEGSAVFVPDFDREPVTVVAGRQAVELLRIVGDMIEVDHLQLGKSHLIFPRFRPLAKGWEYTARPLTLDGAGARGFVLIENRKLGCYNMGYISSFGKGAATVGKTALAQYDQWCIAMPGADFTLTAGGQQASMAAGDVAFVPKGTEFCSACGAAGRIDYVWLHLSRAYEP